MSVVSRWSPCLFSFCVDSGHLKGCFLFLFRRRKVYCCCLLEVDRGNEHLVEIAAAVVDDLPFEGHSDDVGWEIYNERSTRLFFFHWIFSLLCRKWSGEGNKPIVSSTRRRLWRNCQSMMDGGQTTTKWCLDIISQCPGGSLCLLRPPSRE